ncbi:MAG: SEC-C metal-binding domain-containing protein [Eubacteriaceae bacterium]
MSLYSDWKKKIQTVGASEQEQREFWNDFCMQEKNIYEKILDNGTALIEGTVEILAKDYNVSIHYFMGFLDGINDSIKKKLELDNIELDTQLKLEIDFKELYKNMLAVPAEWLYSLEQWNTVFSLEERNQIRKDFNRSKIVFNNKIGRNEPCPCGSGKKYKKCCG